MAPNFTLSFKFPEIIAVCRTSLVRAVTLSLHQLVLLGLVGFASVMAAGSVSVFQFAFNLQSVPLAIIGVSYSVAAFPLLAKLYVEKQFDAFAGNITTALRHIIFWSLPAIALIIVIRAQFVRAVLGTGAFDWSDTRLTAAILALFMLSLASQTMHLLLVRALYAVGNTRLPFYITLGSSSLALLFSFIFYSLLVSHGSLNVYFSTLMRLEGVANIEVLALPLGYSCAIILHSIVLLLLAQKHIFIRARALIKPFLHALCASIFGGYVAYATLNYFVTEIEPNTLVSVFSQGLMGGAAGLAGVILVQYLFRSTELFEISRTIRKRFKKGDVVVPQDEDHFAV